jgi:hypothetical protein
MSSIDTDNRSENSSIPLEFTKSDTVPSPTSSPPIPLQSTVVVRPVKGCVGVFEVTKHPMGLDGNLHFVECHQIIVMTPNPDMLWHLAEVELGDDYVEYSALNTDKQVIRYLRVPKLWTVEGRLEGEEDETLII